MGEKWLINQNNELRVRSIKTTSYELRVQTRNSLFKRLTRKIKNQLVVQKFNS